VRAFLRRPVEGCQRLEQLNHEYNLRASVQHGATIAAVERYGPRRPQGGLRVHEGEQSQTDFVNSLCGIEVLGQVRVHHIGVAPADQSVGSGLF
jgi:hypothetical protein